MTDQEREQRVGIGLDRHKRSVTIEVMAADESVLMAGGRYATDVAGFAAMRAAVSGFTDRVWAIEGCRGIGGWARNTPEGLPTTRAAVGADPRRG